MTSRLLPSSSTDAGKIIQDYYTENRLPKTGRRDRAASTSSFIGAPSGADRLRRHGSTAGPLVPQGGQEKQTFDRYSTKNNRVTMGGPIELPETEGEAIQRVVDFFDFTPAHYTLGAPSFKLATIMRGSPEKEKILLKALQLVYKKTLRSSDGKLFFMELVETIKYPETVSLITQFFQEYLEKGHKAAYSKANNDQSEQLNEEIAQQRFHLAQLIFANVHKSKLPELLCKIIEIEIRQMNADPSLKDKQKLEKANTILRMDTLATCLGKLYIDYLLKESIKKLPEKLNNHKLFSSTVDWKKFPTSAAAVAIELNDILSDSRPIQSFCHSIANTIRKEYSSFERPQQDQIAQDGITSLLFLRSISPFFTCNSSLDRVLRTEFSRFLMCCIANDKDFLFANPIPKKDPIEKAIQDKLPALRKKYHALLESLCVDHQNYNNNNHE